MKNLFFAVFVASLAACTGSHSSGPAVSPQTSLTDGSSSPQGARAFGTPDPASQNDALLEMRQKIDVQRQAISQEKSALDQAIARRETRVHFGKDLMDTIAYGVSSGALGYRFMTKTNSIERIRSFFAGRNLSAVAPAEGAAGEATAVVPVAKAKWLSQAGTVMARTTEFVSAAVLGAFFIGDVYNLGSDVVIWFDTTEQIRQQRSRLAMAEKSLEVAEQNLETAIQSNKEIDATKAPGINIPAD